MTRNASVLIESIISMGRNPHYIDNDIVRDQSLN